MKAQKKTVTRDEMHTELEGFSTVQKIQENQLGQIRDLFNTTINAMNEFMANTNATLELTQESLKLMLRRTEALEKWIKDFASELARQEKLRSK